MLSGVGAHATTQSKHPEDAYQTMQSQGVLPMTSKMTFCYFDLIRPASAGPFSICAFAAVASRSHQSTEFAVSPGWSRPLGVQFHDILHSAFSIHPLDCEPSKQGLEGKAALGERAGWGGERAKWQNRGWSL
jgi:hypothetical protein